MLTTDKFVFLQIISDNSGAWVLSWLQLEDEFTPNLPGVVSTYVQIYQHFLSKL